MSAFETLRATIHRLRAPGGCPWDRKQTHRSLRPHALEETCEFLDVVDTLTDRPLSEHPASTQAHFIEELGDMLMQVMLHAEIASESGAASIDDVAQALNDKLIRRHPHVFGDVKVDDADAALATWKSQKAKEKTGSQAAASLLARIPRSMPALERSQRVIEEVSKVGFQWSTPEASFAKVREEFAELEEALAQRTSAPEKFEHELGDALFALCNLGHLSGVSPVQALRSMLARFESRFAHVEARVAESGKTWEAFSLEELDAFWNEAKKQPPR